jgi:glycolate oxidase iron-sulfur subunit
MGREENALAAARKNVDAWTRAIESDGLDAIVITASGCGTTIKDYGFMLRLDPAYAGKAARVSALAKDITEYLATLNLPAPTQRTGPPWPIIRPVPCSMARRSRRCRRLLRARALKCGSRVKDICAAALQAPTT